jgi:hypothetical protein
MVSLEAGISARGPFLMVANVSFSSAVDWWVSSTNSLQVRNSELVGLYQTWEPSLRTRLVLAEYRPRIQAICSSLWFAVHKSALAQCFQRLTDLCIGKIVPGDDFHLGDTGRLKDGLQNTAFIFWQNLHINLWLCIQMAGKRDVSSTECDEPAKRYEYRENPEHDPNVM